MSEMTYGDEGTCGYTDCTEESEWTRLTDGIGPGLVYVCEHHRCREEGGDSTDVFTRATYTRVEREPAGSQAVIAHLLKAVARG